MSNFVHLHNHTSGSLLDGLSTANEYAKRLASVGQTAMAITDHGNMFNVVNFYRMLKKANIKPIIGYEAYSTVWNETITQRGKEGRELNHVLLLAETQVGYNNLIKLASTASTDGFYYKARIDKNILAQYSEGLITTSGCMASPICEAIGEGKLYLAEQMIRWNIDVFADRFYIELQRHIGIPELDEINKHLLSFAKKYNLKSLITNDTHYARPEDADPHGVMLCIQTKKTVDDPKRFKFTDNEYYLKSEDEMRNLFLPSIGNDEIDEIFRNTVEVSERCNVNPDIDISTKMPDIYHVHTTTEPDLYLRTLAFDGLQRLGLDANEKYVCKLEEELKVITQTKFTSYFLLVYDLCMHAKKQNISYNTRGSAAGSLVFYAIGVSFIDPLENGLLFSRFLSSNRVNPPDADLDFPDAERYKVFDYIIQRYGEDNTAQVVTFGTMKARMAVRDVGRALGLPQEYVDKLAKTIKNTPGKPIDLHNSRDKDSEYYSKDFDEAYRTDNTATRIIDYAMCLENKTRHTGVHAAAILISPQALKNYVPLMRGSTSAHTKHITQYDYPTCESLGLLKIDCLGLATLSIIDKCCKLINERHNMTLSYHNIPYDDKSSYDLLTSGNLIGVFQVENSGLRRAIMRLKPSRFSQVSDIISLYRPGPIQYLDTYIEQSNNPHTIEYKHESLKTILENTAGIMVFQEQVIKAFVQIGGFTEIEADEMRKAIGKKNAAKVLAGREKFIKGGIGKGIDVNILGELYDDIDKFAGYSFNLAHAASYSRITLITAWLKANYPLEYITTCLQVEGTDEAKRIKYINDAKHNGIKVLPPLLGTSSTGFTIDDNSIRFGYENIRSIGEKVAQKLAKVKSLKDLSKLNLNKSVIEALVAVGVFDVYEFGKRDALLENIDTFIEFLQCQDISNNHGQKIFVPLRFLFTSTGTHNVSEYEKKYLGVWLDCHPLNHNVVYDKYIKQKNTIIIDTTEIANKSDGDKVAMIVVVQDVREVLTKKGDKMAFVQFSDNYGVVDTVIFPKTYANQTLTVGDAYHIMGIIQIGEENATVLVNNLIRFDESVG